jgi:outer membrane protein TolC
VWACAFGLGLSTAAPVLAQDEAPAPDSTAAEAPAAEASAPESAVAAPEAPPSSGQLPLSLRGAIARALEKNLDVELVRYDPAIAAYEERAAWGVHEPVFLGDATYLSAFVPTASGFTASGDRRIYGSTGIQGILPLLGWQYNIGYDGQKDSANSAFTALRPEYRASLGGTLSMPILRGFLYGLPWVQVRLAGKGTDIANEQFRSRLMDVVRGTEDAYWGLAAASRSLDVARKSLETSRALLKQTQAQFQVGVVSKVEVTEAEAGVAQREFSLIAADNFYRAAQDSLIDAVFGPALTPTSSLEIVIADSPENYQKYDVDPTIATEKALANRPELIAAQRQLELERIRLQFAKNQRLPQLDLTASYTTHGLAGVENPTRICSEQFRVPPEPCPPLGVPTAYGKTGDQFFSGNDNRTWYAGAKLSVPIGNSTARANVRIGEIDVHKAETALDRERQAIVSEVRNAVRNLQSAIQGIEAAERRRIAAAEQHRAEQIRLEHGESTPFDVLQREEVLVDAESQKIAALRVYHASVVALDRAQGTLLEARGIAVDSLKRDRVP